MTRTEDQPVDNAAANNDNAAANNGVDTAADEFRDNGDRTGSPARGLVASAVFIMQTAGSGIAVYAVPIYIATFLQLGLATDGELSFASGAFYLSSSCSAIFFGHVDRRHATLVLVLAALAGTAAVTAMSVAPTVPVIVASFSALGLFFQGFVIVGTTILVEIFHGRPTGGMALATAGSSAGGIIVSPILALLISRQAAGPALLQLAIGFLIVSLGSILVIRRGMSGRRRSADHASRGATAASGSTASAPVPPAKAVTMLAQWPLLIGFSLVTASQLGATAYSVTLGVQRGFAGASLAVFVTTASAVACRWLGSAGIRRCGLRRWTLYSISGQALGVVLMGTSTAGWMMFAGCVLVGQSLGNTLLIRSQVVVDIFSLAQFSRRFGQFMTCTSLGSAAGPLLLGQLVSVTQNYLVAYLATFALNVVALPFLVPWLRSR